VSGVFKITSLINKRLYGNKNGTTDQNFVLPRFVNHPGSNQNL